MAEIYKHCFQFAISGKRSNIDGGRARAGCCRSGQIFICLQRFILKQNNQLLAVCLFFFGDFKGSQVEVKNILQVTHPTCGHQLAVKGQRSCVLLLLSSGSDLVTFSRANILTGPRKSSGGTKNTDASSVPAIRP